MAQVPASPPSQTLTVRPGASPSATTFPTLTAALAQARPGTLIRLSPGTYSAASGEQFPLTVPDQVTVVGDAANRGAGIVLTGGAAPQDQAITQTLTLQLEGSGTVEGITVTNSAGSGIGIGAGAPVVQACQVHRCGDHGIWVGGRARPAVVACGVEQVGASGIWLEAEARAEVRDCVLRQGQTGITVTGQAAPLLCQNQIMANRVGLVVSGQATPVLRHNQILQNQTVGLWVQDQAHPDLGQPQDSGGNRLRYQGQHDIKNDTPIPLVSVGNDVVPQTLAGRVTLQASTVPAAAAIAALGRLPLDPASPQPANWPPVTAAPAPEIAPAFADTATHWANPYISALAQRHLVKGFEDGRFRPDAGVTRAQFAALVATSFPHQPPVNSAPVFTDVPPTHWATSAIRQICQQGFMGGYPDGSFRPDAAITRVQGMVAVVNGLALAPGPSSVLSAYQDRAQIPSYGTSAVAAATQQQLVINYPDADQLRPLAPLTRGELAALVYQGMVALNQAPALTTSAQTAQVASLQPATFADVAGHWGAPFIAGLTQRQLMQGFADGSFRPNAPVTRAEFASLIGAAFQPAPRRSAVSFSDVSPSLWSAAAIEVAYRGEFLSGFPDGSFAPDHNLLRVQTWVALVSGLKLSAQTASPAATLQPFRDRDSVPAYAHTSVATAIQQGLVINVPELSRLAPNRVASRADAAAAVYQALVALGQVPPVASPYLVGA